MNRSRICLVLCSILSTSCFTTTPSKTFAKSNVIERMGNKDETPEWATGEIAMRDEGQDVIFISQMTMGADSRSEACLKAAELDGRSAMSRYIKEGISSSGQVDEANAKDDPSYEALTAFLSNAKLSGIRPTHRYWEKVETSDESGDRVLKLRCSAKLAIKKSELARQLKEATSVAKGGNPKIRESLLNAQQQFLENLDDAPAKADSEVAH